jgi:N-acetylmuramoyl-L-alanine amidase
MDITFYYTNAYDGEITFPQSDMIKSMKWIKDESKNIVTLRIYFKNEGNFMGYNVYYDENNFLVVTIKEPSQSLSDRVIMIDPGHGGNQPGAGSGTGVFERDVTYKISQELKSLLEKSGATVIFTRDNSKSVPEIEERRLEAYSVNPDMFVSIHCDSSESKLANGSSVYYYKNYSGPLAFAVSKNLPAAVKSQTGYAMQNKGAHFYPFLVIRLETCPSVLVECGFISNADDFKIINSDKGRKAIAKGIYDGIVEYYS